MKKLCFLCILCLLIGLLPALAEAPAKPERVILYTYYRQLGWGDRVQVGCVDEKGGLWFLAGHDGQLHWPYGPEKQLEYLAACSQLEYLGALDRDGLEDLKSLVSTADDAETQMQPAACDAGTEFSFAVRWDRSGEAAVVRLGMSGDDLLENPDPNATALYFWLRRQFPAVTSYAGVPGMGPAIPAPVSIRDFCGFGDRDFSRAVVTAWHTDCEAGIFPVEVTEKDAERLRQLAAHGMVTGKANSYCVTGGTTLVCFADAQGNALGSLELYRGLLVTNDGMYAIATE